MLDFGAGFLFGLSITVALFAAMEDDVGPLAHNMLLAALAVLGLAIAAKLAARGTFRRGRAARRTRAAAHTGWTIEAVHSPAADARGRASSSNDHKAARDERTSAALPQLKVARRNGQTTAEGDSRRL